MIQWSCQLKIPFLDKFGPKNETFQVKLNFGTYNHFHNNLRIFVTLPNFLFTRSETKRDY